MDSTRGTNNDVIFIDDLKTKSNPKKNNEDLPCICTTFSIVLIVGIIILLILAGSQNDECPDCPRISITSLQVSSSANYSFSSSQSSAADIIFDMVLNNDAERIKYSDIHASVFYDGSLLASTSLYAFEQEPKEITEKKARIRAANMDQIQKDWISKGKTENGVLSFDISMSFRITTTDPLLFNDEEVSVFCDGIKVKFTDMTMATGSMLEGSKDCRANAKYIQDS